MAVTNVKFKAEASRRPRVQKMKFGKFLREFSTPFEVDWLL